ncbi:hypothetical protein [Rhodohalobacter barkolensis]|nr:hypothetical protein [Rhodohalobacter barkolensis]
MSDQTGLKQQLVSHIRGGQAFSPIETVLKKINFEDPGRVSDGIPYSFYQQFANIRLAQLDILEYCTKED